MANPARGGSFRSDGEALEILRRLEPALSRVDERMQAVEAEVKLAGRHLDHIEEKLAHQGEGLAELRGKVSQLPTLIQIVTAVLAVNAGIVAIGFGLSRLLVAG